MASSAGTAPIRPSRPMGGLAAHPRLALVLPVAAIVASTCAMIMLAREADDRTLDYGVGLVPLIVPWLTAGAAVVVAVLSTRARAASSSAGSLLLGALVVLTAWSVVILPFDVLRLVGLAPPWNAWGAGIRLLLLTGSACALVAATLARRSSRARCPACGRVLPGRLDRIPRWPVGVAVAASFVYPALRVCWAMGGTFGTAGEPLQMDAAVAWAPAFVGALLVAFTLVLFAGRGPLWVRALLGFGGVGLGLLLAMAGGLGAVKAATDLVSQGLQSILPEADLMTWTFVLVYGSWFLAGLGVTLGSWRFWAHRRDGCPGCSTLMGGS